jgi:hypothetical protein
MPPQQPATQGTPTVAAPPSGDPAVDVQGAGNGGGMDKFRSIISRLSGGGTPAIDKALQQHHDEVMADAQRRSANAKSWYSKYMAASRTGKDPVTGQPMTPDEIAKLKVNGDKEMAEYGKIAGKSKQAKPLVQQMAGAMKHVIAHHDAAIGQPAGPSTQQGSPTVPPPPQGAAPPSPQSGTVPPPPTGAPTAASATPTPPTAPSSNPLMEAAQRDSDAASMKEQDARRIKDQEYRDKLTAEADPRYHVNDLKRFRDDLHDAFPQMSPEDVEKAMMTKAGVTPKGAGKEMQPDFKDGMLVGVKNPATNEYYTDPTTMPPEAKAIYDSAKKVEKAHEAAQDARDDRRFQHQITASTLAFQHALDRSDYAAAQKEVKKARSDYDSAIDRQTTMHQNLDAGLKGDQQAMLSLVANHIGMTLGAQKGARITRAVWDEATSSAPWLAKLGAKFSDDGYLSGVTLTPEQMRQMVDLGDQKVGILKDHVDRVEEEYKDDLDTKTHGKTVPPPPSKPSNGKTVSLAAAKKLPQNRGKSDDDIKADIKSHGYKVGD